MGKKTWQRLERNDRELKERLERVEKEGTQEVSWVNHVVLTVAGRSAFGNVLCSLFLLSF